MDAAKPVKDNGKDQVGTASSSCTKVFGVILANQVASRDQKKTRNQQVPVSEDRFLTDPRMRMLRSKERLRLEYSDPTQSSNGIS